MLLAASLCCWRQQRTRAVSSASVAVVAVAVAVVQVVLQVVVPSLLKATFRRIPTVHDS